MRTSPFAVAFLAFICAVPVWAQDAFETDDTAPQALVVTGNVRHNDRSIEPLGDVDMYRFDFEGTATLLIETNRRPADSGKRVKITILDDELSLFHVDKDSLVLDVPPGTYYAVLEADNEVVVPAYDVSISVYPHSPDAFESNNNIASAVPLERGTLHRFLNLTPDTDEDWFVLNPGTKGGDSVRTIIHATSTVRNVTFALFDAEGLDETPNPFNRNELIVNMTPGDHKLRVTDHDDDGAVPNYTLTYWIAGGPDPYEDDDTPQTASGVNAIGAAHNDDGHVQLRSVFPETDEDWVRFYVDQVDNVQLSAFAVFGTSPLVEVYDETGTTLIAEAESGFAFLNDIPDGYYLARIFHDSFEVYDEENVYELDIFTIPIPRFSQGTLAGIVTSPAKAGPIEGAAIDILTPFALSTTSAANGVFVIDALPQGAYGVRATATGFDQQTVNVNVGSGVTSLNIDLVPDQDPAVLVLGSTQIDFLAGGGAATIGVSNGGERAMTYEAAITGGAPWLAVDSGATGGDTGTIGISAAANDSSVARSGTVQVTGTEVSGSQPAQQSPASVTIMQSGLAKAVLNVGSLTRTVAAAATSASIGVSNAGGAAMTYSSQVTSGSEWLTIGGGGSGGNSGQIALSFDANESDAPRTATVEISAVEVVSTLAAVNSPTTVTITQSDEEAPPQDLNGDGEVDAVDIQLIINAVLGLGSGEVEGDVNGDGEVDAVDIQLIINAALGV